MVAIVCCQNCLRHTTCLLLHIDSARTYLLPKLILCHSLFGSLHQHFLASGPLLMLFLLHSSSSHTLLMQVLSLFFGSQLNYFSLEIPLLTILSVVTLFPPAHYSLLTSIFFPSSKLFPQLKCQTVFPQMKTLGNF